VGRHSDSSARRSDRYIFSTGSLLDNAAGAGNTPFAAADTHHGKPGSGPNSSGNGSTTAVARGSEQPHGLRQSSAMGWGGVATPQYTPARPSSQASFPQQTPKQQQTPRQHQTPRQQEAEAPAAAATALKAAAAAAAAGRAKAVATALAIAGGQQQTPRQQQFPHPFPEPAGTQRITAEQRTQKLMATSLKHAGGSAGRSAGAHPAATAAASQRGEWIAQQVSLHRAARMNAEPLRDW
jgi:hypothetical protein